MKRFLYAFFAAVIVVGATLPTLANPAEDCSNQSGYVEFGALSVPSSIEPASTVDMNGELLNEMSGDMDADAESTEFLQKLHCIKLVEYETSAGELRSVASNVKSLTDKLLSGGWSSFFSMNSGNERVSILYKKGPNGAVEGILFLSFEQGDAGDSLTFINVVGGFNMSDLGKVMQNMQGLDLDQLGVPGPNSK